MFQHSQFHGMMVSEWQSVGVNDTRLKKYLLLVRSHSPVLSLAGHIIILPGGRLGQTSGQISNLFCVDIWSVAGKDELGDRHGKDTCSSCLSILTTINGKKNLSIHKMIRLPFSDKRVYPTSAIRIVIDWSSSLKKNSRQPQAAKWSLTGPLLCRGPVNDHLAAFGCLGFVVRELLQSMMILIADVG